MNLHICVHIGLTQHIGKLVFIGLFRTPLPPSLARGEGPKGGGRIPRCVDIRWSKIGISAYRGQKCVFAVGEHIVEGSSAYSPRPSATPLVNEGGKGCAAFLTNTNFPACWLKLISTNII